MRLPAPAINAVSKFNKLSLRERALVSLALLAAIVMSWDSLLMEPLQARENALSAELHSMQTSITAVTASIVGTGADPTSEALEREAALRAAVASVDEKLASTASGLIEPERMIEVINDVLSRQRGVRLISLRNKPVEALIRREDAVKSGPAAVEQGPYVHPVELTIEGGYLDVLAYLQELEKLPWRIYWKRLEMETLEHPTNRVRIELRTLSMDKAWIGV